MGVSFVDLFSDEIELDSHVFIGSMFGDSQVIRLNGTRDVTTGSYVDIMEVWSNTGPITDFAVVDLDRRGQSQVV